MPDYSEIGVEDINGKVTKSSGYVLVGKNPKHGILKKTYDSIVSNVKKEVYEVLSICFSTTTDFTLISVSAGNNATLVVDKELEHLENFISKLRESDSITPQIASIEKSIADARKKLQKK